MQHWLSRTELLIGSEALHTLQHTKIAILGLGGVGGAAAEAVCRAGVGSMLLADCDTVDLTNLNRQLIATTHTVGMPKTQAAAQRLLSIAPQLQLTCIERMLGRENLDFLAAYRPDYVIDAIDNVTAKLALAELCAQQEIPLLTCLGTGNRLDPSQLHIGTVAETAGCGCPLARVMRRELKKRGLSGQMVLYSTELPRTVSDPSLHQDGRHAPASMSFVPPAAGFLLASYAVRSLLGLV